MPFLFFFEYYHQSNLVFIRATGSGVAMDAASRGLSVALVERDDFAAGTSSRSTKLIHGGIRYLAQAFQSKVPPKSLLDFLTHLRYDHGCEHLSSWVLLLSPLAPVPTFHRGLCISLYLLQVYENCECRLARAGLHDPECAFHDPPHTYDDSSVSVVGGAAHVYHRQNV